MNFVSFQNKFNIKDFPLAQQMIEKNDYSNNKVYYISDYDGLAAMGIYEEGKDWIKLNVLEVRKDCQGQKYGTKLINKLKSHNKEIFVRSLAEARNFYLKQGFSWADNDNSVIEFVYEVEHE